MPSQACRREADVTALGVSFNLSSVAHSSHNQTIMWGASDQKKEVTLLAICTA